MIPAPHDSTRIKCRRQPLQALWLQQHHIKAARRRDRQAHQVMPGCKDDASLLGRTDAGTRPTVAGAGPSTYLDKHGGAVCGTHDQVDFATAASRRPIIALHQPQAGLLQMAQSSVFGGIADAFGARRGTRSPVTRKYH